MTARRMAMVLVGVLALSVVTAAQSKGKTKAQGKVVDEEGQPLGDVIVAAVMEGMDKPFQQAKTNNKGEWYVQNLAAGQVEVLLRRQAGARGEERRRRGRRERHGHGARGQARQARRPRRGDQRRDPEGRRPDADQAARRGAQGLSRRSSTSIRRPSRPFRAQVHGAVAQTYMAENQAAPGDRAAEEGDRDSIPANVDLQLAYGEILMQADDQRAEGEKVLLGAGPHQGEGSVPVHEHHHRPDQRSEGRRGARR